MGEKLLTNFVEFVASGSKIIRMSLQTTSKSSTQIFLRNQYF